LINEAVISLSDKADLYLVPAANNSMTPEIAEGDLVLFDKRVSHDTGKVVVLCFNGSFMIRGIVKSNGNMILRARNWLEFKDIEVTTNDRFHILGVVLYSISPIGSGR